MCFPQVPGIVPWPAIRNSLNLQDGQTLPQDRAQRHADTRCNRAGLDLKQVGKIDDGRRSKDKVREEKKSNSPGWFWGLAANPPAGGL